MLWLEGWFSTQTERNVSTQRNLGQNQRIEGITYKKHQNFKNIFSGLEDI